MTLLHSTVPLYDSTSLYMTLQHSTMPLYDSLSLYMTLHSTMAFLP